MGSTGDEYIKWRAVINKQQFCVVRGLTNKEYQDTHTMVFTTGETKRQICHENFYNVFGLTSLYRFLEGGTH